MSDHYDRYNGMAEVVTDCISRQDTLEAFGLSEKTRKYGGDHSGYDTMMMYEIQDTIEDLPPIQPEIVRCKDCKHFESEYGYCDYYQWNMTGGDFCSKAEKREVTT